MNTSIACLVEALLFMASMGYTIVAHYALVSELQAKGVEVPKPLRPMPLYAVWKYSRARAQLRTGELDFLAITEPLALAVGLVCWALLFQSGTCP